MRRALILMVLVTASAAVPSRAEACSCAYSRLPCEQFWDSPVVFAGTVVEILPKDAKPSTGPSTVRFRISEPFRGVDTPEVVLHQEGSSCDLDFAEGQAYLVYAYHRRTGAGWSTGMCTRTRPLRNAYEDLVYLRLPDDDKGTSRIVGSITQWSVDASTPQYSRREIVVPHVPVRVTGDGKTVETVTDGRGMFSVAISPYRSYQVRFGEVEGLAILAARNEVWVPHPRACVSVNGSARHDGRVAGVVTSRSGQPVPFFPVSLRSSPNIPLGPGFDTDTLTDARGRFEFRGVQPATFQVETGSLHSKTPARQPLTPVPFAVAPGGRSDLGRLRLTTDVTLLEVTVFTSEGNPAENAQISVSRADKSGWTGRPITTDARGSFRLSLLRGSPYRLEASVLRRGAQGSWFETGTVAVDARRVRQTVQLRLAPSR